jgi:hypothetical protein
VRQRVLTLHIVGVSNRQIAQQEKLDRETVSRILSQEECTEAIAQARSRLTVLMPKAIEVCEKVLSSKNLRIAAPMAMKLLESTGLLGKQALEQPDPVEARRSSFDEIQPEPDCHEDPNLFATTMWDRILSGKSLRAGPYYVTDWLQEETERHQQQALERGEPDRPLSYDDVFSALRGMGPLKDPPSGDHWVLKWFQDEVRKRFPDAEAFRKAKPDFAFLLPPPSKEPE